jgi:hypothetical protein
VAWVYSGIGDARLRQYRDAAWCGMKGERMNIIIPFEPKVMIFHNERLFAVDEKNRIWWSAKGDFNKWYDEKENEGKFVESSAGWWDLLEESETISMESMKLHGEIKELRIITDKSTYILAGDTYDTFKMVKII